MSVLLYKGLLTFFDDEEKINIEELNGYPINVHNGSVFYFDGKNVINYTTKEVLVELPPNTIKFVINYVNLHYYYAYQTSENIVKILRDDGVHMDYTYYGNFDVHSELILMQDDGNSTCMDNICIYDGNIIIDNYLSDDKDFGDPLLSCNGIDYYKYFYQYTGTESGRAIIYRNNTINICGEIDFDDSSVYNIEIDDFLNIKIQCKDANFIYLKDVRYTPLGYSVDGYELMENCDDVEFYKLTPVCVKSARKI